MTNKTEQYLAGKSSDPATDIAVPVGLNTIDGISSYQDGVINQKESPTDLRAILTSPDYSAEKLMGYLSNLDDLKKIYAHDAGVWEKYSIGKHTGMVLSQYDKYFANTPLPNGITPEFMRFVLAFHDIGKGEAIDLGDKTMQHEHTLAMFGKLWEQYWVGTRNNEAIEDDNEDVPPENVLLAEALLSGDPIGKYLKGGNLRDAIEPIKEMNENGGMENIFDFLQLLLMIYQVDAGSYTEDAGGLHSLDGLFNFQPSEGKMEFAKPQLALINRLRYVISCDQEIDKYELDMRGQRIRDISRGGIPIEVTEDKKNRIEIVCDAIRKYFEEGNDLNALREIALMPELEISIVNKEQMREFVSVPGTPTHVTGNQPSDSREQRVPLEFWFKTALGITGTHQHNVRGEEAVSFNVTTPDGKNASLDNGSVFSLDGDNKGEFSLVVFSKNAMKRLGCSYYMDQQGRERNFTVAGRSFDSIMKESLLYHESADDFFERNREQGVMNYQPYNVAWETTINEYSCWCLMVYEYLSSRGWTPANGYDSLSMEAEAIKYINSVAETGSHLGHRFRGIIERDNSYFYDNIDPIPQDIAAIGIPIDPGKQYVLIKFIRGE